jgi:hypothetical protein
MAGSYCGRLRLSVRHQLLALGCLHWFSVHGIFKRHALGIVLGKPCVRGIFTGEHLEMILVANLLACVDVNPDRHGHIRRNKISAQINATANTPFSTSEIVVSVSIEL